MSPSGGGLQCVPGFCVYICQPVAAGTAGNIRTTVEQTIKSAGTVATPGATERQSCRQTMRTTAQEDKDGGTAEWNYKSSDRIND
ncbi:hypothetical protein V9T40_011877 [Parthenolecanium corni]|uniref:Uncharacterized protein n=1 Tax=Parthenolecanium corni TaxID=536013 RepID=A0AAN9T7V2_9HEMI